MVPPSSKEERRRAAEDTVSWALAVPAGGRRGREDREGRGPRREDTWREF